MKPTKESYVVCCISARRPMNVPLIEAQFAPDKVIWFVPSEDAYDYRHLAKGTVVSVSAGVGTHGLPIARNLALLRAGTGVCIQTSDDLKGFLKLQEGAKRGAVPATWPEVREALLGALDAKGAHLAGLPPTANPFFSKPGIKSKAFIIGDLFATFGDCRFDETLPLKEDYDFSCRHLEKYGQVARVGDFLAEYAHYKNRGGAVSYRTEQLEEVTCARLLDRWPQYLHAHPRRKNEVVLR